MILLAKLAGNHKQIVLLQSTFYNPFKAQINFPQPQHSSMLNCHRIA